MIHISKKINFSAFSLLLTHIFACNLFSVSMRPAFGQPNPSETATLPMTHCNLENNSKIYEGCLQVTEKSTTDKNVPEKNDKMVGIYYRWYKKPDLTKHTMIFMNGGPGGKLQDYLPVFASVEKSFSDYNVLFFDQRGSGRSSYADESFIEDDRINHYRISNHVSDLEELRNQIVKNPKISLMGHSFGTHLAYAYAAKHKDKVTEIYALSGSADFYGTLMQPLSKKKAVQNIFAEFDAADIDLMIRELEKGSIVENSVVITYPIFLDFVRDNLKTYHGLNKLIKEKITTYIKLSKKSVTEKSKKSSINQKIESEPIGSARANKGSLDSPTVTLFIDCFELLTKSLVTGLPASPLKTSAQNFRTKQCDTRFKPDSVETIFDVKDQVASLNIPILVLGGRHDVYIPISVQQRDFAYFSAKNPLVKLAILENVGHDPLFENPECLNSIFQMFRSPANKQTILTCQ